MNIKSFNPDENDIKDNENIIVQKDYGLKDTPHPLLLDPKKLKIAPDFWEFLKEINCM